MRFSHLPLSLALAGAALLASMTYAAVEFYQMHHRVVVHLVLAQGAIYALAVFAILRLKGKLNADGARQALIFGLGVAAILRAMIFFAPPHSTDVYNYIWNGRVQTAGVSPYIYVPSDPALARLRDGDVYPNVNRKDTALTPYPPVAQGIFFLGALVSQTVTMMKLLMLAFEALAIWAIARLLARRGLPRFFVLIYAWHPLAVWEIAGSAHIDIVPIAFSMLAILAADMRRFGWAGASFGAAFAAKYFPLVLAPAIYRRWGWKFAAAFIATVALLFLPYISAGKKLFGFFGDYSSENGVSSGTGLFLPELIKYAGAGDYAVPIFLAIGAALLGALALRTFFRSSDRPDLAAAFALATAFTVLFSPHYAWYFLWLTPFLCFYPSAAVLYITLAAPWLYRTEFWPPSLGDQVGLYAPFAALLVFDLTAARPKEKRGGGALAPAQTA